MADPTLFTPVSDNTLLPFAGTGATMITPGGDNVSNALDISAIFENGFSFGRQNFTELYVATNGGVSFGRPDTRPYPSNYSAVISPFYDNVDTRYLPADAGVWLDFNTARDSVVVTWSNVGFTWAPNTFQMELMDLGGGDAEIIFRYADMRGSGNGYDVGASDGDGSTPWIHLRSYELGPAADLDTAPGNSRVPGVWQFRVIDGALQPVEDLLDDPIFGTNGDDSLTGSLLPDRIESFAGNDTIEGMGGADRLIGRAGDDSIDGGTGSDTINGGDGNDTLQGGDANDQIVGGAGHDQISEIGFDEWRGGSDVLQGMGGDDSINGGAGRDTIAGQEGNDVLNGGYHNDILFGGLGDDFIWGGHGSDTVTGGEGADYFFVSRWSSDRSHIMDYNAAEGDRLVFDGRYATPDQFSLRWVPQINDRNVEIVTDLEVVLTTGLRGHERERVLFTFENPEDIDQIILRLPFEDHGDVITFDLV